MDILKNEMAPITKGAWKEIKEELKIVLNNNRTARKFVDIDGPYGFEFSAVPMGKLIIPEDQKHEEINYGIRSVLPMVEVRKPFELDIWELDNVSRGAKDINLDPLEEAALQLVRFEEQLIYKGLPLAGIKGLVEDNHYETVPLPKNLDNILRFVGKQINTLQRNSVEGPYTLVLNEKNWLELINLVDGYPIIKQLKEILGGEVIANEYCDHSFLVSERGGDYELILGEDATIGYDSHDSKKVKLFLTQTLSFRVLSPEAKMLLKDPEK